MRQMDVQKRNYVCVLQLLLIYLWLIRLVETEAFFSVYAMLALLGCAGTVSNSKKAKAVNGLSLICTGIFAGLISAAVLMAEYPLFVNRPFKALFSFLGGTVAVENILIWLLNVSPRPLQSGKQRLRPWTVFLASMSLILFIDSLFLFRAAYPGILSPDSLSAIKQIMVGTYNNTTPYWHTMFLRVFFEVGMAVSGDINIAVAFCSCAQILIVSACMAFAVLTIYQSGLPNWYCGVVLCLFALMPYHIVYSVTMWKDVLFAAFGLLLVASLIRIFYTIGKHMVLNYVWMVVGAVGFCLIRTNGWYAFLVTGLIFLCALGKKRKFLLIVIAAVLVISWILIGPLLTALQVAETDPVEALAVPFQQIARYIHQGFWLDDWEKELLEIAFDLDKVKEVYTESTVDPVKFRAFRRENLGYIKEHFGDYVQLYLSLGRRFPHVYFEAWVEETKGFWNAGYLDPYYYLGVWENDLGILDLRNGTEARANAEAFLQWSLFGADFLQPFLSIGLHVWILGACCLVCALQKREEFLLCVPFLILAAGLWFGTPVVAEFRYGYPMILVVPIIVGVTIYGGEKKISVK